MTDLEPRPAPPSARRGRDWLIAGAQSLVASAVGLLLLLVGFGFVLEQHANDPPAGQVALVGLDVLLGLPIALAIGPMRMLPQGRARTIVHLVAAAATGLSAWAAPAGLLALYRIGVAQRPMIERLAVGLLALTTLAQLALDSAAGGETDRWDWLATLALALGIGGGSLILGSCEGLGRSCCGPCTTRHRPRNRPARPRKGSVPPPSRRGTRPSGHVRRPRVSAMPLPRGLGPRSAPRSPATCMTACPITSRRSRCMPGRWPTARICRRTSCAAPPPRCATARSRPETSCGRRC